MKEYCCTKCGSTDVFMEFKGSQTGLYCGDCGAWLKWVSKKEIPLVSRFIEANKDKGSSIKKDHIVVKKILPEYFQKVESGRKNFELRKDEDNIQDGDILVLKEYKDGEYTDRTIARRVTYVLRNCEEYGLMKDYCIIGFQPVDLEMISIDTYR